MGKLLPLSIAMNDGFVTRQLISGEVGIGGTDPSITAMHSSELFWRQLHYADFDASELSLASLMIAYSNGNRTWKALPIFNVRRFFHTEILVRDAAGITRPRS